MNSLQALDFALAKLRRNLAGLYGRVENNPNLVVKLADEINDTESAIDTLRGLRIVLAEQTGVVAS
jgi:hypothetical protein